MAIKMGSRLALANNNPGNLRYVGQPGASQGEGGFARFESPEAGYEALKKQIELDASRGHTVSSFVNKYAPPVENDTNTYVKQATSTLGVSPDTPVNNVDRDKLAKFIAKKESSTTVEPRYKVKFETGQTVVFDSQPTPEDIEEVAQKLKLSTTNTPEQEKVSETNQQETKKEGFFKGLARDIITPPATMLARPIQLGAQLAGVSDEDINKASAKVPFIGEGGALDLPKGKEGILKDLGRGAQTLALGLPVTKLVGALGAGALMGGGSALERGEDAKGVATESGIGALAGLAGKGLTKALSALPNRLAQSALRVSAEQGEQALMNKSIGTVGNLLKQSNKALNDYGSSLGNLISEKGGNKVIKANQVLKSMDAEKLKNFGLSTEALKKKLISTVPENKYLVDKLFKKGLSVTELHKLTSSMGKKVFATGVDTPKVRAGKNLGNLFYQGARKVIGSIAPESEPIFEQMSKEYAIQKSLGKLAKKSYSVIKFNDLVPFAGGSLLGGPAGGFGAALASRAVQNPAIQFGAAKIGKGLGKVTKPVTDRLGLLPSLIQKRLQSKKD